MTVVFANPKSKMAPGGSQLPYKCSDQKYTWDFKKIKDDDHTLSLAREKIIPKEDPIAAKTCEILQSITNKLADVISKKHPEMQGYEYEVRITSSADVNAGHIKVNENKSIILIDAGLIDAAKEYNPEKIADCVGGIIAHELGHALFQKLYGKSNSVTQEQFADHCCTTISDAGLSFKNFFGFFKQIFESSKSQADDKLILGIPYLKAKQRIDNMDLRGAGLQISLQDRITELKMQAFSSQLLQNSEKLLSIEVLTPGESIVSQITEKDPLKFIESGLDILENLLAQDPQRYASERETIIEKICDKFVDNPELAKNNPEIVDKFVIEMFRGADTSDQPRAFHKYQYSRLNKILDKPPGFPAVIAQYMDSFIEAKSEAEITTLCEKFKSLDEQLTKYKINIGCIEFPRILLNKEYKQSLKKIDSSISPEDRNKLEAGETIEFPFKAHCEYYNKQVKLLSYNLSSHPFGRLSRQSGIGNQLYGLIHADHIWSYNAALLDPINVTPLDRSQYSGTPDTGLKLIMPIREMQGDNAKQEERYISFYANKAAKLLDKIIQAPQEQVLDFIKNNCDLLYPVNVAGDHRYQFKEKIDIIEEASKVISQKLVEGLSNQDPEIRYKYQQAFLTDFHNLKRISNAYRESEKYRDYNEIPNHPLFQEILKSSLSSEDKVIYLHHGVKLISERDLSFSFQNFKDTLKLTSEEVFNLYNNEIQFYKDSSKDILSIFAEDIVRNNPSEFKLLLITSRHRQSDEPLSEVTQKLLEETISKLDLASYSFEDLATVHCLICSSSFYNQSKIIRETIESAISKKLAAVDINDNDQIGKAFSFVCKISSSQKIFFGVTHNQILVMNEDFIGNFKQYHPMLSDNLCSTLASEGSRFFSKILSKASSDEKMAVFFDRICEVFHVSNIENSLRYKIINQTANNLVAQRATALAMEKVAGDGKIISGTTLKSSLVEMSSSGTKANFANMLGNSGEHLLSMVRKDKHTSGLIYEFLLTNDPERAEKLIGDIYNYLKQDKSDSETRLKNNALFNSYEINYGTASFLMNDLKQRMNSLPLTHQAVILATLSQPAGAYGNDSITAFKNKEIYEKLNLNKSTKKLLDDFLTQYLNLYEGYPFAQYTVLCAISKSIYNQDNTKKLSDQEQLGLVLNSFLQAHGTAGAKIAQLIHSNPSTPEAIKDALKHFKEDAFEIPRWEYFHLMDHSGVPAELDGNPVKYVGKIRSGSTAFTTETHYGDQIVAVSCLIPGVQNNANIWLTHLGTLLNNIADEHREFEPFRKLPEAARKMIYIESDTTLRKTQHELAESAYTHEGVNFKRYTVKSRAVKWIDSNTSRHDEIDKKGGYTISSWAPGKSFSEYVELIKEKAQNGELSENHLDFLKQIAISVIYSHLLSIMKGKRVDQDRHGGNIKIEVKTTEGRNEIMIHHFDFGCLPIVDPDTEEREKAIIAESFINSIPSILKSPENFLNKLAKNVEEHSKGIDSIFLDNFTRGLMSVGDLFTKVSFDKLVKLKKKDGSVCEISSFDIIDKKDLLKVVKSLAKKSTSFDPIYKKAKTSFSFKMMSLIPRLSKESLDTV